MQSGLIRRWAWVHKWSSLVCTLFLLMLCITGLPLIFHDEIDAVGEQGAPVGPPSARAGQPLDRVVAVALDDYRKTAPGPGVPLFVGFSANNPLITVTIGSHSAAPEADMQMFSYNRSTGARVEQAPDAGVMDFLLQLHTDLLLGLPGKLFLGAMGLLFLAAIVSGIVLYAPFMRRLPFGALRHDRSARVRALDEHNFLGAITLGWALVIGVTGAINAFADPLVANWRGGELAEMVAARGGAPVHGPVMLGSIDRAMASARAASPGLMPQFIGFPGGAWSSARHYAIFFQGDTPLTSHLLTPALVDAATGRLDDMRAMPVAIQALMLSQPLHFGDYGGLPLKLVWAVFDLATIWVLWTGLVLWLAKHRRGV
ncbi:MAG: PepSY-associated TM helix domain-containing protein [Pseudomonadota bacterium]